jgi:branched-chain amino acid aminotransferase
LTSNILNGITRDTIINLIKDLGMPFVEHTIPRAELYTCEEAFFTGTAAEVAPILSVDRKPVGTKQPGRVTVRLSEEYERLVTGRNEKYLKYLTPVYGSRQYDLPETRPQQRSRT